MLYNPAYCKAHILEVQLFVFSVRLNSPRLILNKFYSTPFRPLASFSEYQRESTFYRELFLQCIPICNSAQAKSDVNIIRLEEIRQKLVLCSEHARTQFLFLPVHKQNETPLKIFSPSMPPSSHAHIQTHKKRYACRQLPKNKIR